ncbi:MAG: hypothetical protein AAFY33_13825 [Cyanobacteria bacterium J06643_4]
MHLSIKSALPFALIASPLLLAATQPLTSEASQQACGAGHVNASFSSVASTPEASTSVASTPTASTAGAIGTSAVNVPDFVAPEMLSLTYAQNDANAAELGRIVHPVAASLQVLITSEQEWDSLVNAPQSTARFQNTPRLFVESPYGPDLTSSIDFAESEALAEAQTRCNLKEDPSADAEPEESEAAADDIPNLDPSVVPPAPADAPATAPELEEMPAETDAPTTIDAPVPADSSINVPTEGLSPVPTVRPEDLPVADPLRDPNNFTPEEFVPTPFDGSWTASLESLPDGSYRYLAGSFETRAYSDDVLVENGGSIFLLTKVGNQVTGNLMPRLGLPGICVTGTLSGDVITGAAYPDDTADIEQESAREVGDEYEPYGSGALQIRRSQTVGDRTYYADALLDLSNFSRINAGTALAPTACEVPTVEAAAETATD